MARDRDGSMTADQPVLPKTRGNAREGTVPSRTACSARATRLPESDKTVSTKLARLVPRRRKEARLTKVVQYVHEAGGTCGRSGSRPYCRDRLGITPPA